MIKCKHCLKKCTFGKCVEEMEINRDTLKMIFGEERVEDDLSGIIREIANDPKGYRQKVLKAYAKAKAEDDKVCTECGGNCCKAAPCHWSPEDIEDLSYEGLKKFLSEKKYISIVRIPAESCDSAFTTFKHDGFFYYFLRTRTRRTGIAAVATRIKQKDKCMLLTDEGCKITFEERAKGARFLIPQSGKNCRQLYDLYDCFYDWKDYQDVLRKLFYYFRIRESINPVRIIKNVHL